jgi:hypothetical protein
MATSVKSFTEFKKKLQENPDLQNDFKADPVSAIRDIELQPPAYLSDVWVYRIVVIVLGLIIVGIVAGVTGLMISSPDNIDLHIPTMLTAIGSAALGALTGLLAPSPASNRSSEN